MTSQTTARKSDSAQGDVVYLKRRLREEGDTAASAGEREWVANHRLW